jgi:hypothetical protein
MALRPSRISLALRPRDLVRQGKGLLLDETSDGGDRILVWAE